MFVKLLDKEDVPLILNIDNISSLEIQPTKWMKEKEYCPKIKEIIEANYIVRMNNGDGHLIDKDQYEQLCKILTTRL